MKLITSILAFVLVLAGTVQAQDLGAASMGAPTAASAQDIALTLDKATGKIDLVHKQQNVSILKNYELSHLELEIFDENGEYAGSLELSDFLIPKDEIDQSEKVKVANIRIKDTATGEEMTLTNVDFSK